MIVEVEDRRFVAHLSAAPKFATHIYLVHDAATRGGVRCQRLVAATDTFLKRLRAGLSVVLLDYITGAPNNDIYSVEDCSAFGELMASLHNVDAPFWGSPASPLPASDFRATLLEECKSLEARIVSEMGLRRLVPQCQIHEWLEHRTHFLTGVRRFSLVHGDPHQDNVLFDGNGKPHLIDLDVAEYSLGAIEIARCLMMPYSGLDLQRQMAFLNGYQKVARPNLFALWCEDVPMASVVAMLHLIPYYLNKAVTLQAAGETRAAACLEVARRLWLWQQHIVAADPGSDTDWPSLVSCAPRCERLAWNDDRVVLGMRRDSALRRHMSVCMCQVQGLRL